MQVKNLYYVISGYPVITHTFLYNQISDVIESDRYNVNIIVFNRHKQEIHDIYKSLDAKVICFPLGTGLSLSKRILVAFTSIVSLMFSWPSMLIKSLNGFKYGRNAFNLNYAIFANRFRKIDADVFHCHFGPAAALIADLKDMGAIKAKMITSFHGMDITVTSRKAGLGSYERLFRVSDMFTGNSSFTIKKMFGKGCPSERTYKIPMGINMGQFPYRGSEISDNVFRILTVGRLVEKKGHEFSLRALAIFNKHKIPFRYDIIGDGPLRESLTQLSSDLGIGSFVFFHGPMKQEHLVPFYKNCNLFLMPSVTAANGDTEGQGLVLQEAQAIGVPVVATLHNGFPDSIIDGTTGFLVPEKDHEGLYEKILLLSKDDMLRAEMGASGRSFVEQSFDSKVVVKSLMELYDKLC